MANSFTSPDGDIENLYITDYNFIDRYVTTGTLWAWGINNQGQLGDNTLVAKSSPVQNISNDGKNWSSIVASVRNTIGIKTDGTLWVWGDNGYGQLGNNTAAAGSNNSSPVQTIAGGTNWKMAQPNSNTSYSMTAAVKTDGTLWTWGHNSPYGQLGINTINTVFSSPIQTIAGGTNWKTLTVGGYHVQAIYFYDAGNLYPSK